ncbi:TDT family transporter [Clostridium sp. Marseille-P2415]|uniref:TDT family transporter n=1 Tax=Clostridium sp. Marseille-P2415 TaxID=1805471 RepID=UPI00190EEBC1|nr:TDT family transporter [Clostridium sp. Marseille-P2415]
MKEDNIVKRLAGMPVPILPTMVGAITLANFMQGFGYEWICHITLWSAAAVWLFYMGKIILYPQVCKNEYGNTIPRSLYAGLTMIMMGFGAYVFAYSPMLGKGLLLIGIGIHACHILYFTYRSMIRDFNWDTFMPSWFVTYNGIMVSTVVGSKIMEPLIGKMILYYGIGIYFILIPVMVYRLLKKPVNSAYYHTQAVVLAPCSLCVVSYINLIEDKNMILLTVLYLCVLASLMFILLKLPKFFSFEFYPGYAGLTFPMAIGTVASAKMAGICANMGYEGISNILTQITGLQFYLSAMTIGYVLLKFVSMLIKVK